MAQFISNLFILFSRFCPLRLCVSDLKPMANSHQSFEGYISEGSHLLFQVRKMSINFLSTSFFFFTNLSFFKRLN